MFQAFTLIAALTLALPASADAEAQKEAILKDFKQETVALGNNRFLIIDGGPATYEYVYGFDMIRLENGVPKREPLFMQAFDAETRTSGLSEGVAISALNYNFDKNDSTLTYTSRSADNTMRYRYRYTLDGDMFLLEEVIGQEQCEKPGCTPKPPFFIFRKAAATAGKQ